MACRNWHINSYLLTLFVVPLVSQGSEAIKTSCEATVAIEGYSTTVTCHFEEDLSIKRRPLSIVRYDFGKATSDPELILSCRWYNSHQSPVCRTGSLSIAHEYKGREASITFTSTSPKHAGLYKCVVDSGRGSKTCSLHVRKAETSCTDVFVKEGETAAITCNFNSDLSKTHDDFYVQWFLKESQFETVLSCNWIGPGDEDWSCFASYPFTFKNEKIKDTVTFGLRSEVKALHGQLLCNIVSYTEATVRAKRCNVVVGQDGITTPATSMPAVRLTAEHPLGLLIGQSVSTIHNTDQGSSAVSASVNISILFLGLCSLLLLLA